jgi:hypothetical protein
MGAAAIPMLRGLLDQNGTNGHAKPAEKEPAAARAKPADS